MEPCTDTSKPDYDTHTHEVTDVRSNAKRNILKNAVVADVEGTLTGCLPHRMQSHVLVKFVQIGRPDLAGGNFVTKFTTSRSLELDYNNSIFVSFQIRDRLLVAYQASA